MTPAALAYPRGPLPLGIARDRPLAPLTSFKIGGPAAFFAEPAGAAALAGCLAFAAECGLPVVPLGGGTNLLISDAGFPGLVVRCGARDWAVEDRGDHGLLRAGARAPLAAAARGASLAGWSGFEWAEGIPGTIGGAVVGNAGAFGGETAAILERVSCFSPGEGEQTLCRDELGLRYRGSSLRDAPAGTRFLLAAEFRLQRGDAEALKTTIQGYAARRRAHTPVGSSCGSVFQNPPGDYAGRLIEAAGLKGTEEGAAFISPVHANYIVNRGGARAVDVLALIDRAREEVARQFGVRLELEVRMVGFGEAGPAGVLRSSPPPCTRDPRSAP